MEIQEHVPLGRFTTFGIGGPARYFCAAAVPGDIVKAAAFARERGLPVLLLGGGSNVLVSDEGFSGMVIHMQLRGIEEFPGNDDTAVVKLGAGEPWDGAVALAVARGWWGIENLSHIPGSSGAFAVQNVGAYGQEASQVVTEVEALNLDTGEVELFGNRLCGGQSAHATQDCEFSYRHSVFNTTRSGQLAILSVSLRLSLAPRPNLSYGDVKKYFAERGNADPSLLQIREAITEIRDAKFPYPDGPVNGNAGSFFRGPVVSDLSPLKGVLLKRFGPEAAARLDAMKDRLAVPQGFKTPAAFLLELCGLKGFSVGGAQVNIPQPAIVLNRSGQATARDVLALKNHVLETVFAATGVELEIEPVILENSR